MSPSLWVHAEAVPTHVVAMDTSPPLALNLLKLPTNRDMDIIGDQPGIFKCQILGDGTKESHHKIEYQLTKYSILIDFYCFQYVHACFLYMSKSLLTKENKH